MEDTIALDSIQAVAASFGASFDAEQIVDTVVEKDGTQYYKVRWVKYSWEPAASFSHLEHLIRDFWNQFGGIPESLQDLTGKHEANNRQTTGKNLAQVLHRESTEAANQNNISASILTPVSAIDENVANVQTDENHLSASTAQLSTSETESANIISAMQHITLPTQGLQKPIAEVEIPIIVPTLKQSGSKKSRIPGEPKKRRKIPGNCNICGKHFQSTTNIAAHKKLHTEERQYECNDCGRKFRRKLHLVRHQESHAGIKSYVCNICGSFFSSKWYMKAHSVIHTGDKPYKCDICQKCFNNKANLNKHKLIHENNRPFVCNECGRTYRQSYDLKRHMSTHSMTKNFSCTYCDRSFAMKSYLQRHLLTHVSDKKFTCEICNAKFFQRGHLNYHIKHQHGKGEVILEENSSETCFRVEESNENNTSKEKVDNLGKKLQHKSNELASQHNEFFSTHNNNTGSIVFLSTNDNNFHGGNAQVVSSKQIYQSYNTPNISIAVNNSIPQKCLIIDANNLVEKRTVILESCENNQICLNNPDEDNQICLNNPEESEVHSNSDIVNIRHTLDEKHIGENISHNSVGLDSIHQSQQDVTLSVLTSEHAANYFGEREVLEMSKGNHIYL